MGSRGVEDMKRYAIYFTPAPDTPLWQFGSSVLGYDASTGRVVAHPRHPLFAADGASDISAEPRRYGFHATLKAPFALSNGWTEEALLRHAAGAFATRRPVRLGHLEVATLGRFLALRPSGDASAIGQLANFCVETFEPFRAPLPDADRARRMASQLTERQVGNLDRWGYPHVFEDFRFHMTLTGVVAEADLARAYSVLSELYAPIDHPVVVDAISVVCQPRRSERFVVMERFPLSGGDLHPEVMGPSSKHR